MISHDIIGNKRDLDRPESVHWRGEPRVSTSGFHFGDIAHPITPLTVLIGLLLTVICVPADVEAREALRLPALVFILSVCLVPTVGALRSPKSLFRAENVLLMSPVYWLLLDPLQGRFDMVGITPEEVEQSFIAIALFIVGAWIAFIQRPLSIPRLIKRASQTELPPHFYFGIGLLAFTLCFLKYAIPAGFDIKLMVQALLSGRWQGPWNRGALGGTEAFLDHLAYFGYLLPPLTVVLARRLGWANFRTLALFVLSLITVAFLVQGGGRRLVGMYLGSGAIVWFLGKTRIRFGTVFVLGLLVLGSLFIMDRMLAYREVGVLGAVFGSEMVRQTDDSDVLVRVDDNFVRLAQITGIFPELYPYTTWRYVLWVAVRPVPRVFWPSKPIDPGFDLAAFLGVRGASLSSSVIGELFMAWGFLAVIIGGWFYGKLAASLTHFLVDTQTAGGLLIYTVGLFALFTGMRSMIELVLTSYIILAWIALVNLYEAFGPASAAPAGTRVRSLA